MPKLNFEIKDEYLVAHTILSGTDRFSSTQHQESISALQKKAQEAISEGSIPQLNGLYPEMAFDTSLPIELQELAQRLKSKDEYRGVIIQPWQYQRWIERKWLSKHDRTLEIMQDITGLDLDDEFVVYLTHPSLRNGKYLGQKGIAWGHNEDWPNYSIVYLWHEMLHAKLPYDEIAHGIIELATDEELRVRLNGGQYPPFVGHSNLVAIKKRMLPDWRGYLTSQPRNILKFYRRMSQISITL